MLKEHHLYPNLFFLSTVTGFMLCVICGHLVSHVAYFQNFVRFYPAISPTLQYYPTIHEVLNTVKKKASADKTLVIVGGNSAFRGAGQNDGNLWTLYLEKLLGAKYTVLNVANDAAETPSFGGVVFRIMNELYPKSLLVTTLRWGNIGTKDGFEPYNYLFWDAYYKGLIHTDRQESEIIKNLRIQQMKTHTGMESHLLGILDSQLYFRNLWNWVGYNIVFTVWTKKSFKPRKYVPNEEINLDNVQKHFFNNKKMVKHEKEFIQSFVKRYVEVSKIPTMLYQSSLTEIENKINESFPNKLHKNILFVLIRDNKRMFSFMEPIYYTAGELFYTELQKIIIKQGYQVIDLKDHLLTTDFLDSIHPNVSGGIKIGNAVAHKLKNLANSF